MFPARAPILNSTQYQELVTFAPGAPDGLGRSAGLQAGFQFAALALTLVLAIVGGLLTGLYRYTLFLFYKNLCHGNVRRKNVQNLKNMPIKYQRLGKGEELVFLILCKVMEILCQLTPPIVLCKSFYFYHIAFLPAIVADNY